MTGIDSYPERVRRLSQAVKRAQYALADTIATRDAAILEAVDAGHGLGTMAAAAGLARSRVQQIVANTAARAAGPPGLPKVPHHR